MERIILTTGGTGGHIFPALSVAEEVLRRNPRAMVLFMGGIHGQEADMAAKAGLDFVGLPVRGILGRGLRGILAVFSMLRGLVKAYSVIRKVKPELVVGFGGYAGFAGVLAARIAGKATAVHEQNSYPGMTNRLLGKVVNRIFLSMPDTAGVFDKNKTVLVGNPVRAAIAELYEKRRHAATGDWSGTQGEAEDETEISGRGRTKSYYGGVDAPSPFDAAERKAGKASSEEHVDTAREQIFVNDAAEAPADARLAREGRARRSPRLLVMGGSLGARAINRTMTRVIGDLLEAGVEIWHQTGQGDYESVRAAYREAGAADHLRVEAFIADMQRAYAWADLVLCRAGGSSMAEITAAGLPAVLVPLPWAAQDHQRHNARFLEREGGAVVLEQSRFYSERKQASDSGSARGEDGPGLFVRTILSLLQDRPTLEAMARKSLASARPYAAHDLVDGLEALIAR